MRPKRDALLVAIRADLNRVALDALTTLASRMGFDANGSFPIGRHPSLVDASRPGWLTTPTNGGSDVR